MPRIARINSIADFNDAADNFVAENERPVNQLCEIRPVSQRDVKIRVANSAGFHFDENFTRRGRRTRNFFD